MSLDALRSDNRRVVLVVDDDDDDVRLIVKSMQSAVPQAKVLRVENGLDAMALLRRQDPYQQAPRPALVLLDLNMPQMSGHEALREIKSDAALKDIPVVILSTSDDERTIAECYTLRANSYVTKPANLKEFRELVGAIGGFWLNAATPSLAPNSDESLENPYSQHSTC